MPLLLTLFELGLKAIIDGIICMRIPKFVKQEATLGCQRHDMDDDSNDLDQHEERPLDY